MKNKKRPKYTAAKTMTLLGLKSQVNKLIEQGYEPKGGIIFSPVLIFFPVWCQAMVLKGGE